MTGSAQCRGDKYSGELKCRIAAVVIVRGMIWRLFVFFTFRMQAVMLTLFHLKAWMQACATLISTG
jgi:hypothetical protein